MRTLFLVLVLIATASVAVFGETGVPAVAIHVEKEGTWNCSDRVPDAGLDNLTTTYDGVGEINAFVVFYGFKEARGLSFGIDWPEAWGEGLWHDCGDLRLGSIKNPGDMTGIVWHECKRGSDFLVAGWITLTVTSPGLIEVIPSAKEGVIAVLDCDLVSPTLSEAMVSLRAGAGGLEGDPVSRLTPGASRRWLVRADSSGDAVNIDGALRSALPGDTVMVAAGTYRECLILRRGVVVLGSWDEDFTTRDLELFPSILDGVKDQPQEEHHHGEGEHAHGLMLPSVVEATIGADSTTVLDGFVITGGDSQQGGAVNLRNGAEPVLSNLIIHSNSATYGGGIFCHSSSPTIANCLIASNEAGSGGAIYCTSGASPVISNTTIVANRGQTGAAVAVMMGSSPTIERSIIADHRGPSSIYVQDRNSGIVMSCCDLWDNQEPQYGGVGEEVIDLRDNISADPRFANPPAMDFTPGAGSPVLSVPDCGTIGTQYPRVPGEGNPGDR